MCSTFMGMNIVSETHDILVVARCVLHRNFYCNIIHFTICIDWRIKDNIFVFVDVLNVARNPAFVVIMLGLFKSFTFIRDGDLKTAVQKG